MLKKIEEYSRKIFFWGWYCIRQVYYNSLVRCWLKVCTQVSKKSCVRNSGQMVIVSITTYPAREKQFLISLETVMRQTYKPDRIIVWLAEEQYPEKGRVQTVYKKFIERGVEIRFCDDLRSHKKYYYAALENPDAVIITLDDDVYYPRNTIERLIFKYDGTEGKIISNIAKYITVKDGVIQPYVCWKKVERLDTERKELICPIGVGGVLYSPHSLNCHVFNKEDIRSLCSHTDDLWLNAMGRLNHSEIICIGDFPTLITVKGSQTSNLGVDNVVRNDYELAMIIHKYPDSFGGFISDPSI